MQLEWLEEFLRVASLESITLAAKELHLSQPSLSKHMKSLEAELGGQLLQRTNTKTTLTPLGRALQVQILEPVHLLRAGIDQLKCEAAGAAGDVRLATFLPYKTYDDLIAKVRYAMVRDRSFVEMKVRNVGPGDPLDDLRKGNVDLVFIQSSPKRQVRDDLVFEPILAEPLSAVVPSGSPLAERDELKVADLSGEQIQFYASETTEEHNRAIMEILDGAACDYHEVFTPWDPNYRNEVNYANICGILIETQSFLNRDIASYVLEGKSVVPLAPAEAMLTTSLVYREGENAPAVVECIGRIKEEVLAFPSAC